MSGAHITLRLLHIGFGFAVLILLWIPISTRKGGRSHRRSGRLYTWAGRTVIATAVVSSVWHLVDPEYFIDADDVDRGLDQAITDVRFFFGVLGVLGAIALAMLERGVHLTKRSSSPAARTWLTAVAGVAGAGALGLGVWGLAGLTNGIDWQSLVRIGVAVLGLDEARKTFAAGRATSPSRTERITAHLDAMLGSAAAFYTAFAVFGFTGLLDLDPLEGGPIAFLPWFTPFIVFALLITWWKRRVTAATVDEGSGQESSRRLVEVNTEQGDPGH